MSTAELIDPKTKETELRTDLSEAEAKKLEDLEGRIRKFGDHLVALGKVLIEIRDKKLYRAEFSTFEAYCREKWQFSDQSAYNAMKRFENTNFLTHDARIEVKPDPEATALRFLEKIKDEGKKAELYTKIVDKSKEAGTLEKTDKGVVPDAKIAEETVNRSLAAEKSAADRAKKNSKAGKAEGNGHKPKVFKDELKEMDQLLGKICRIADAIYQKTELESTHKEKIESSCQVTKNWIEKWRNALKAQ